MALINPYFHFDDCRLAMNFYQQCFGGQLNFVTVGETPMAKQMPEAQHDKIMHSSLVCGSITIMGTDMSMGENIDGNTVEISINCVSEDEIKSLFSKLSRGGHVTYPLNDTFWGATYGAIIDKFGKHWMLNYDKPKN